MTVWFYISHSVYSKLDKIPAGLVWPHIWPHFEQQVGFRWHSEINFMNYFDPASLNLWSKYFALDIYFSYLSNIGKFYRSHSWRPENIILLHIFKYTKFLPVWVITIACAAPSSSWALCWPHSTGSGLLLAWLVFSRF